MNYVCVDVNAQCHRMAISKSSEALVDNCINGEGGTVSEILEMQPDIDTIINGSFFYFAKTEATYGRVIPNSKSVGDGVALTKIRNYVTNTPHDSSRFGYLVQTKRGEPFQLLTQTTPNPDNFKYILSCSPVLIVDGTCVPDPCTEEERSNVKGPPGWLGHLWHPNRRSMIGVRSDGCIVMAVSTKPLIYPEMQQAMIELKCVTAFALDGGGSSFLWSNGCMLASPDDPDRKVGNTIVVFK